jgi:hypothetical protein
MSVCCAVGVGMSPVLNSLNLNYLHHMKEQYDELPTLEPLGRNIIAVWQKKEWFLCHSRCFWKLLLHAYY